MSRNQLIEEHAAPLAQALMIAAQKLAEFEQDCIALEDKHHMSFAAFEQKVNAQPTEIFEDEEDCWAWKFAEEGAKYWREQIALLKQDNESFCR